jgi:hemolysin activation/secretion protein
VVARSQAPESQPTEETPEAAIEPTPLPGTEIPLEPQLPPSEAPLRKRTVRLVPPGVVEPILPPVNFEALARSGRLWSFHGLVKEFRFQGNHVFSNGELAKLLEKYKGRELTAEDLEQARQDLTLLYINKGYVNSGAVLPDQDGKTLLQLATCRSVKITKTEALEAKAC